MIIELILVLLGAAGFVLNYVAEHKTARKLERKKYGLIIMAVAITGLAAKGYSRYLDSKKNNEVQSELSINLKEANTDLHQIGTEFDLLQAKYDSLLVMNGMLRSEAEETSKRLHELQKKTETGFAETNESIHNIGKATGARIISQAEKESMIGILSRGKGQVHFELPIATDQETQQYVEQLKDIFNVGGQSK